MSLHLSGTECKRWSIAGGAAGRLIPARWVVEAGAALRVVAFLANLADFFAYAVLLAPHTSGSPHGSLGIHVPDFL
jgi:hypothetical protein